MIYNIKEDCFYINYFMNKKKYHYFQQAFTVVELLVVISIIIILAAIITPAVSKAKAKARAIQCASQLRRIGQALLMYALDNHELFPPDGAPPNTWASYIYPAYTGKGEEILDCPTHGFVGSIAAGPDYWYVSGLGLESPPKTLIVGCYNGCHYGYENKLVVNGSVHFLLPLEELK